MTLVQTSATYNPPKKSRSLGAIGEDGELVYTNDKKTHDRIIEDFDESNPGRVVDKVRFYPQPLRQVLLAYMTAAKKSLRES